VPPGFRIVRRADQDLVEAVAVHVGDDRHGVPGDVVVVLSEE
jgi:hypothetical protein